MTEILNETAFEASGNELLLDCPRKILPFVAIHDKDVRDGMVDSCPEAFEREVASFFDIPREHVGSILSMARAAIDDMASSYSEFWEKFFATNPNSLD